MKFICLQENLKEALTTCERTIGKNVTLPVLNNILIEDDDGRIKISSTDLEVGINFWLSGKIIEKGSITCPARILANLVNNLPNQKIELEGRNNVLSVKSNSIHSSIQGISAEDFPIIPKNKNRDFIGLSSLVFKNALTQVINSVAVSETRPEISGIFLKINQEGLKLTATDSFRLGEKTVLEKHFKLEDGKAGDYAVIFPQKIAQEIIRVAGEQEKPLKIFIDSNQILFSLGNINLISRLIEGQYPDYQAIIPKKTATQVKALKDEFLGAIKIAGIFSSKVNDVKVKVLPQKSVLEIESRSEFGNNRSQVSAKVSGSQLEAVFNFRYLIDGLANISSKEVVMEFNDENSPAVLRAADDSSYFYIVMPIRSG
jgi:DNA polymerase-3 subunit beta